ncbi:MAG: GFA family protein [Caulobacteraceae bacterium]|nr:GFA family protein [Caulobacteraceae bacterium]
MTGSDQGRGKPAATARGGCACGAVRIEMTSPATWAWHDHGRATQRAHGAQAGVFVGSWKKRVRVLDEEGLLTRWSEPDTGAVRGFCGRCGTPLLYERPRSPHFVNIPRAVFETGVGREPRYHLNIEAAPAWAYRGEPLGPLKGFPGVLRERPGRRKPVGLSDLF